MTDPCFTLGWVCCTEPYRHTTGLIKSLVRHALLYAQKNGFQHMLSVLHPPTYDLMHHCFKVEKIGSPFFDEDRNVEMLPVYATAETMINQSKSASSDKKIVNPVNAESINRGFKENIITWKKHYRGISVFFLVQSKINSWNAESLFQDWVGSEGNIL